MDEDIIKQNDYFEHSKYIIDPNIHKFLYVLVKYLFFDKKYMSRAKNKLFEIIKRLKIKGLYKEAVYYNICHIETLKAIFDFIKTQNYALASEIYENIIIRVLSFAFITNKEECFGKYLYNNLEELKKNYKIFIKWIDIRLLSSLFNEYNESLDFALEIDNKLMNYEYNNENPEEIIERSQKSTFLQILFYIFQSKILIDNEIEKSDSESSINYENFFHDLSEFFDGDFIIEKKEQPLTISSSILISSYIYHQNNISPFMEYSKNKDNLENLPFSFDISEADIGDIYINSILSPIRIEPRVTDIELNKNEINIKGIFELYKLLMFNKSIKKISLKNCLTKSNALKIFNDNYISFNNYSVEELDISSNYLKSDVDTNLSKLITHLKGLKILVLSNNILKSGLGYFFVTLKNLYRKNESKLKELYLTNCDLDDISFYELGELVKSKYCKLKCLCLNENKIPSDVNFFKALKKNRSLEEIYFYGCGINSEKTDEIERLISNANLESLYLYTNKIHDFNQYIRIIYRTTLIKRINKKENGNNTYINNPTLYNLNLNNADCYNQNEEKLNIILEGIKRTNLTVLDLSSVLKDASNEEHNINFKYYNKVNKIIDYLSMKQEEYKEALGEFLIIESNKDKCNKNLEDKKELIDLSIKNGKEKNEKFIKYLNNNHFKREEILSKIITKKMILI